FVSDPAYTKEGLAIDWVEVMESPHHKDELADVFPNPVVSGTFQLKWKSSVAQVINLAIYDLSGRLVFEQTRHSKAGINQTTVQTPSFAPGVYLFSVQIGSYKSHRKLVYF